MGDDSPFEDEWSRAFYETLPDLKAMLPGVLLQLAGGVEEAKGGASKGGEAKSGEAKETGSGVSEETPENATAEDAVLSSVNNNKNDSAEAVAAEAAASGSTAEMQAAPAELQAVLTSMPLCVLLGM